MKKALVGVAVILSLVSCQPPTGADMPEQGEPDLYPQVVWKDNPALASSAVVTTHDDKYNESYKGLDFAASFNSSVVEFGFVLIMMDIGMPMVLCNPIDVNGDNHVSEEEKGGGVFGGHTVEIDVIYQADYVDAEHSFSFPVDDEISYSQKDLMSVFTVDYVDADGDGAFLDLIAHPDSEDYTLATFKEIRFIAQDGTNYYTWSNPGL